MRILFLNTNIGYGGASKMMANVANIYASNHDVTFLTYRSDKVQQELDKRVKHVNRQLYNGKIKVFEIIGSIIYLHQYLKKEQFDAAVAFLHPSHYMLILAAIGTKTKVILSERADPYNRKNGSIFVRLVERVIHYADYYVFQSEGAMEAYPLKCRKKSRIIVNALPNRSYPIHHDSTAKKAIVNVARLEVRQKRQDVLFEAFELFCQKHDNYILVLYGDGPDEVILRKMVADLGLNDRVVFRGVSTTVVEDIVNAQIFVLSSDYEGLPNALLEAMAIGLPCISTDCSPGGARMIIENGENGLIVPCGDVKRLAEAFSILAENEELRNRFSARARDVMTKFNEESIRDAWNGLLEEVEER